MLMLLLTKLTCFSQSIVFNNSNSDSTVFFEIPEVRNQSEKPSAIEYIQNEGYWDVIITKQIHTEDTIYIQGFLGPRYILTDITSNIVIEKKILDILKKKISINEINKILLNHYNKKGYLFAEIKWSITTTNKLKWTGYVNINLNEIEYIDTLIIKTTNTILKPKKWNNIINIKKRISTTNTENEIDYTINDLSFIKTKKPSKLLLTDKKNIIFIYPEKKNVNYINGVMGYTNDPEATSNFTGTINLHLENILKSAEIFSIQWKSGNNNQDFKWNNRFMYVYKSVGISNSVHIFKQDTTFTKTELSAGLNINSSSTSKWNIDYFFEQSAVENESSFQKNYTKKLLGVSWLSKNIQSIFTAKKGYRVFLQSKLGNRKSDGVNEAEYQIISNLIKIQPLSKTLSLVGEAAHHQIIQESNLENNSFGFGGFSTIKGFTENRFTINKYTLITSALRFNQQNKFIAELFFQQGFITQINREKEKLQSLGLQFILPVKSGWFNFGVSSGRVIPDAFNFEKALIHFGIKNNL